MFRRRPTGVDPDDPGKAYRADLAGNCGMWDVKIVSVASLQILAVRANIIDSLLPTSACPYSTMLCSTALV